MGLTPAARCGILGICSWTCFAVAGAGSQTIESGAAQAMRGAGHIAFTAGTATHPRVDPAQPKTIVRSFLGSGVSAPVRQQLEVSGSMLQPDMPAVKTQKSSADGSVAAGRATRPGATGFPTLSRQLPAGGVDASDGRGEHSSRGQVVNASLIRRSLNAKDSANGGQVRHAASAQLADSAESFKSSHSRPDQDTEPIDLTSPPALLPQQKDTSLPNDSDKLPKSSGEEIPHHEVAASIRFAAEGMSGEGRDSSTDGNGKAPQWAGEPHHSSGKENAAKHSNSRHSPTSKIDAFPGAATTSKSPETEQQVGHRMHCFAPKGRLSVLSGKTLQHYLHTGL